MEELSPALIPGVQTVFQLLYRTTLTRGRTRQFGLSEAIRYLPMTVNSATSKSRLHEFETFAAGTHHNARSMECDLPVPVEWTGRNRERTACANDPEPIRAARGPTGSAIRRTGRRNFTHRSAIASCSPHLLRSASRS